jgi:FkbM family methyltransferase
LKLPKKIRKKFLKIFGGKKRYQRFFEGLHRLSLAGMNCGGGDNIGSSGETAILKNIANFYKGNRSAVIFDIGANTGAYTAELISAFGSGASIYSFEPEAAAYGKLLVNAKPFSNVKTYGIGFGENPGKVPIYSDGSGSTIASIFRRRMLHLGVDAKLSHEITLARLDDFCRENGIYHIDFMKIDVEGAELSVLKGAAGLLKSAAIDIIQFEFGPFDTASKTFFQDFFYLLSPDFRLYRILKDGTIEIERYDESMEIFLTTNYLAVSRRLTGLKI